MKKSFSLLLALAMVFGMFASVASAADPAKTTLEKFNELKMQGIFSGVNPAGDAGLDQKMNRAQFARVAALILGLPGIGNPDTLNVTVKPFQDVNLGQWYTEEVSAVKTAGLMIGNADGTFNPTGNISVQELAVVTAKLMNLAPVFGTTIPGAASWAAPSIKALQNAGVAFPTNYTAAAIRGQLVDVSYEAYTRVGTSSDISFAGIQSAVAVDNNSVEVTFKENVDAASATNAANYTISDGLGHPTSAVMKTGTQHTVVLKTSDQTAGTSYTITIHQVKDQAFPANTIPAGSTVKFTGMNASALSVKLSSVTVLSKRQIKITFNQEINPIGDGAFNMAVVTGPAQTWNTEWDIVIVDDRTYYLNLLKDISADRVYKLGLKTQFIIGQATGQKMIPGVGDTAQFSGTNAERADIKVTGVTPVDDMTMDIVFSEDVDAAGALGNYDMIEFHTSSNLTDANPVKSAKVLTTDDRNKVRVPLRMALADNKKYYVKFVSPDHFESVSSGNKAYLKPVTGAYAEFTTGVLPKQSATKLKLVGAIMVDAQTVDLKFNRDVVIAVNNEGIANKANVFDPSDIVISTDDSLSNNAGVQAKQILSRSHHTGLDNRTLRIYFSGSLSGGVNGAYKVTLKGGAGADDKIKDSSITTLNFNSATGNDRVAQFSATSMPNSRPSILAVEPVTDTKVKVTFSEPVTFAPAGTRAFPVGLTDGYQNFFTFINSATGGAFAPAKIEPVAVGVADAYYFTAPAGGVFKSGQTYRLAVRNGAKLYGFDGLEGFTASTEIEKYSADASAVSFDGAAASLYATMTVPGAMEATTNDKNSLKVQIKQPVYLLDKGMVDKVSNGADMKNLFTVTGATVLNSVNYSSSSIETVTFDFASDAAQNDVIQSAKLYDATGNRLDVNIKFVTNKWVKQ